MRLLLVHGMGRTPLSLAGLGRFLRAQGHEVERVGYVAAIESFGRIRARIRTRLERLAARDEPYGVIGHSLGGIALRAALPGVAPAPVHFVMLGTPHRPPRLAQRLARSWPYRAVTGESGQLLAQPDFFAALPPLTVPYTIVAGTAGARGRLSPFQQDANDWVVAVEETRASPEDPTVTVPVGHTFMMNSARVREVIRQAFEAGAE